MGLGLEEAEEVPALVGAQVAADVGDADRGVIFGNAAYGHGTRPLVADRLHRQLEACDAGDSPGPGAAGDDHPPGGPWPAVGADPAGAVVLKGEAVHLDPAFDFDALLPRRGGVGEGALARVDVPVPLDEQPSLQPLDLHLRAHPLHFAAAGKRRPHPGSVGEVDQPPVRLHALFGEGDHEAAGAAQAGVVSGIGGETFEQVEGVADGRAHGRRGAYLPDEAGGPRGGLVGEFGVALQQAHAAGAAGGEMVGGAQPPDAAADYEEVGGFSHFGTNLIRGGNLSLTRGSGGAYYTGVWHTKQKSAKANTGFA